MWIKVSEGNESEFVGPACTCVCVCVCVYIYIYVYICIYVGEFVGPAGPEPEAGAGTTTLGICLEVGGANPRKILSLTPAGVSRARAHTRTHTGVLHTQMHTYTTHTLNTNTPFHRKSSL